MGYQGQCATGLQVSLIHSLNDVHGTNWSAGPVFSSDVVSLIAWVKRRGKSKQLCKGTGTRHNLFGTQSKLHIRQLSANECVKRVNPWRIRFGSCFQAEVFVQSESNKGHFNSRR